MNIPYVMKKCTKCGRWLVASTVNFHRRKASKYGLAFQCKECRNNRYKQYYEDNKEKELERSKQYRKANPEHYKQYYEANRDKVLECQKQYREANRDRKAEYDKQYRKVNRERIAEREKQYKQSPQGQVVAFNAHQKRRAKEEQGTGVTKDQWLEMMSFFDWKCAYSGEYLGGSNNSFNRTIDHIVPLNSNGDNMIWNCVPMLRSLNSSKCAKDMLEWYKEQSFYSEARLTKIYEWQEYARKKWKK